MKDTWCPWASTTKEEIGAYCKTTSEMKDEGLAWLQQPPAVELVPMLFLNLSMMPTWCPHFHLCTDSIISNSWLLHWKYVMSSWHLFSLTLLPTFKLPKSRPRPCKHPKIYTFGRSLRFTGLSYQNWDCWQVQPQRVDVEVEAWRCGQVVANEWTPVKCGH